jgi:hypothetical protein
MGWTRMTWPSLEVGGVVDQVNHRAADGDFEQACFLGRGRADLPVVAGAAVAAPTQFLDAQEQRLGHCHGLLKAGTARDAGGM